MLRKKSLFSTVASAGLALALAGPVTVAPPNIEPALAQADVKVQISLDTFHDRLGSHGDWVEYEDGHVWVPSKVAADWRPYTRGHWVFAKGIAWTWVSDEPWGWATYHYGRWGYKDDIGWYWVPGTVWAPAWVSWRKTDKHIAWAPLPPKRHKIYVDAEIDVEPEEIPITYWRVVPVEAFVSTNLAAEIIDEEEAEVIIREARPVGTVRVRKNIVVNDVIEPEFIEQEAKTKVVVHEVREARDVDEADKVSEREIVIFDAPVERESAKSWKPKEAKSIDEVRAERKAGLTEDKGKAAVGEEAMPTDDKAAKVKTDDMKAKEEEKAKIDDKTKTDEMSSEGETAATPGPTDETTVKKGSTKTDEMKVKEESAKTKVDETKAKEKSAKTKVDETNVEEESATTKVDEAETKEKSAKTKVDETQAKKKSAKVKTDEATESETLKSDQGQAQGKPEETTKRKKASSAAAQDSDSSAATGAVGSDESKKPAKKAEKKKGGAAEGATEKAPEEQLPQQ